MSQQSLFYLISLYIRKNGHCGQLEFTTILLYDILFLASLRSLYISPMTSFSSSLKSYIKFDNKSIASLYVSGALGPSTKQSLRACAILLNPSALTLKFSNQKKLFVAILRHLQKLVDKILLTLTCNLNRLTY